MSDIIEHPAHYAGIVIEPIDVIECFPFVIGCALKYLYRAGKKEGAPEAVDLRKARWYLQRALTYRPYQLLRAADGRETFAKAYLLFKDLPPARDLLGLEGCAGTVDITHESVSCAIEAIGRQLAAINPEEVS